MMNADFKNVKNLKNGGIYNEHFAIDKKKSDYKMVKNVGIEFAKMGESVNANPDVHIKSADYQKVFGSLIGTKYERKCPDLLVGGKFYEVKNYDPPFKSDKIGGMIGKGVKQSPNIVINNNKGATDR